MKKKELVTLLKNLPDDSEIRICGNDFEVIKVVRKNSTTVELEVILPTPVCEEVVPDAN
jgi:hypothetical protein